MNDVKEFSLVKYKIASHVFVIIEKMSSFKSVSVERLVLINVYFLIFVVSR